MKKLKLIFFIVENDRKKRELREKLKNQSEKIENLKKEKLSLIMKVQELKNQFLEKQDKDNMLNSAIAVSHAKICLLEQEKKENEVINPIRNTIATSTDISNKEKNALKSTFSIARRSQDYL